jgi:hypothetical protein
MAHLAMLEVDEGSSATWGGRVTDEEYNGAPSSWAKRCCLQ